MPRLKAEASGSGGKDAGASEMAKPDVEQMLVFHDVFQILLRREAQRRIVNAVDVETVALFREIDLVNQFNGTEYIKCGVFQIDSESAFFQQIDGPKAILCFKCDANLVLHYLTP